VQITIACFVNDTINVGASFRDELDLRAVFSILRSEYSLRVHVWSLVLEAA